MDKEIEKRLKALFSHSNSVVRKNAKLMQEYIDLHVVLEGKKPNCASCSFNGVLTRWRQKYSNFNQKNIKKMSEGKNTFKLKSKYEKRNVVAYFNSKGFNKNSDDSVAIEYLMQKGLGVDTQKREEIFEILPEGYKKPKAKKTSKKKAEKEVKEEK